jgi:hypothetical protein
VNPDHSSFQTAEESSAVLVQSKIATSAGPRIERCEFEQLLQRAMEILNARDLKAQLTTNPSASTS